MWWPGIAFANAALTAAALLARSSRDPRKALGRLVAICTVLAILSGPASLGVLFVLNAASDFDQSVSEALNNTALGFLAFMVPTVAGGRALSSHPN